MRPRLLHRILLTGAFAAGLQLSPFPGSSELALAQSNAPKKPSHRSNRQGMFALSKIEFATVVMLGDSLTERAQWSEITGCHYVANRGIGADDSAGVLRRLDEVIKLKPSAVFLMIGVNDVASQVPTDKIVENVQQAIERLKKAGAQVYLTLVLPVTQSYPRQINAKINELNAAYRKLADDSKVAVIDFRDKMRTEDGYLRDDMSIDGIHFAPDGYRIWRDAVVPLVAKHCVPIGSEEPPPAARAGLKQSGPKKPPTQFDDRFGPFR